MSPVSTRQSTKQSFSAQLTLLNHRCNPTSISLILLHFGTNPVIDENTPEILFENSQICHWLKDHDFHPHTTKKLTLQNLKEDSNLREEIGAFVADAEKAAENKKKLKDIGCEFIKIRKEFQCSLTKLVMINPVYAKDSPEIKFERSQILHWIKQNGIHPHTKKPLTMEDLQADNELKEKIISFVNDEEQLADSKKKSLKA